MDLRQLGYVLAVIDNGGFTRAAEAIHVAQPTLSQGIRTLEIELGVDLFERVGRGARLSAAGRALEPAARRAIAEAESARQAATEVLGMRAGRITLITLPTLAVEPLVDWIGAFRAAYPGVVVQVLHAEEADEVPARVRDGRADIGLGEVDGSPAGLVVELEFDQRLVAVCPPGTPVAAEVPLTRLVGMPLVVTPPGTSTRRVVDVAFRRLGRDPQVAVEVAQREAILPLVLAGAGTAFLPLGIAEQARDDGAVLARTRPSLRRRVGLLRRTGHMSPAVAAFVALVRTRNEPNPPA
jgi:DNA-binding transcriptional LysR family regulator